MPRARLALCFALPLRGSFFLDGLVEPTEVPNPDWPFSSLCGTVAQTAVGIGLGGRFPGGREGSLEMYALTLSVESGQAPTRSGFGLLVGCALGLSALQRDVRVALHRAVVAGCT